MNLGKIFAYSLAGGIGKGLEAQISESALSRRDEKRAATEQKLWDKRHGGEVMGKGADGNVVTRSMLGSNPTLPFKTFDQIKNEDARTHQAKIFNITEKESEANIKSREEADLFRKTQAGFSEAERIRDDAHRKQQETNRMEKVRLDAKIQLATTENAKQSLLNQKTALDRQETKYASPEGHVYSFGEYEGLSDADKKEVITIAEATVIQADKAANKATALDAQKAFKGYTGEKTIEQYTAEFALDKYERSKKVVLSIENRLKISENATTELEALIEADDVAYADLKAKAGDDVALAHARFITSRVDNFAKSVQVSSANERIEAEEAKVAKAEKRTANIESLKTDPDAPAVLQSSWDKTLDIKDPKIRKAAQDEIKKLAKEADKEWTPVNDTGGKQNSSLLDDPDFFSRTKKGVSSFMGKMAGKGTTNPDGTFTDSSGKLWKSKEDYSLNFGR